MPTYICGKMVELKSFNREPYHIAAEKLRATGKTVHNPAEIKVGDDWSWKDYMKEALKLMMNCNKVYVLKGFETSKSAIMTISIAKDLGLTIEYERFMY